ncbi:MAG: hypothetical protein ABI461_13295, partial [Polyangiaceae bacterium]
RWKEVWARLGDPPTNSSSLNSYWTLRMRLHGWARDPEGALACRDLILVQPFETQSLVLSLMEVLSGHSTPDALASVLTQFGQSNAVARRKSYFLQIVVEIRATFGDPDKALDALEESARGKLSDLTWLDLCPLLDSIRNHPRFLAVREEVAARASEALAVLDRS